MPKLATDIQSCTTERRTARWDCHGSRDRSRPGAVGRFLVPDPLPERLLFAEPLRRRMRVRFGGEWIADSEDVVLLHEPGRYPVAYFPLGDVAAERADRADRCTTAPRPRRHRVVHRARRRATAPTRGVAAHRAARPTPASCEGRVAFAWRAMDAFYEEDERIVGHAADPYHRIDIRQTSRHLVVREGDRVVADTDAPAGALRVRVRAALVRAPRADIDETALTPVEGQTFCPYKGLASYYDIGDARSAPRGPTARRWPEVGRVSDLVSFEPDKIEVYLDGKRLGLEPGQTVIPHGVDRGLDPTRSSRPAGNGPAERRGENDGDADPPWTRDRDRTRPRHGPAARGDLGRGPRRDIRAWATTTP